MRVIASIEYAQTYKDMPSDLKYITCFTNGLNFSDMFSSYMHIHSLAHSLTQPHTHSLTYSHTRSLNHTLTDLLTHSLTKLITYSFTRGVHPHVYLFLSNGAHPCVYLIVSKNMKENEKHTLPITPHLLTCMK